jgi:hypothetical protein
MAERRMAHGPVCSCPLCIAQYTPPTPPEAKP